jgi:phosphoribosyl 1,2-cyclic phosphate phosphodiesterase
VEKLGKKTSRNQIKLHEIFYGETYVVGNYKVVPLRAIHMYTESSCVLLIEKGGKYYLHLSDTGVPSADLFDMLKAKKVVLDAIAMDCTYGLIDREYFGHMNLRQCKDVVDKLRENGTVTKDTQIYLTHICHWGGDHELLSEQAEKLGLHVAYDGLKIDI